MKKLCIVVLILALLAVPCGAAQQAPATELRFGTPDAVYSISAVYAVLTENVETMEIVLADAVKANAIANYVNGEFRLAIASANAIDLSKALGTVTVTLSDGSTAAPELQLKTLKFNGKKATCNLVPGAGTAVLTASILNVSVPVHNDFPIKCKIFVAAYKESGQMVACSTQTDEGVEQDFNVIVSLNDCADADYVKVFYLTDDWKPIIGLQRLPVQ